MMVNMKQLWRPIETLVDKHEQNLLLCAPELVDLDFNEHGVGMGYYQDDRDIPCDANGACGEPGVDYGGWLASKWDGDDAWRHVPCTPTHYIVMEGP